jgi:hypothetical protein
MNLIAPFMQLLMRITAILALLLGAVPVWCQEAATVGPRILGDVQSTDATVRGAVVVGNTGTSVISGSQIEAGESNADLKLRRGGNLQVCKRSSITLTSASDGREILIALNSGALEAHYALPSTSDTIITPDFRLTLTGPGAFHFAIGTSANGGMCVRSLPGNASSLIVNEQFGDGAHQVKPGEQIIFHNGHVDDSSADAADCGCPRPLTTAATPASPPELGFPEQQSRKAEEAVASGQPPPKGAGVASSPSQAPNPNQTFTQVDAPMVFRAEDVPQPAPSVARVQLPVWPAAARVLPKAEPPGRPAEKKAWYQRFGHALASFFGGNPSRKNP